MRETTALPQIDPTRRGFLGLGALTAAALSVGFTRKAQAQAQAQAGTSLGAIRQIDAGLLNVGYAEMGPADGQPVLLLHGWPYDIHSYVDVAPMLSARGYRVIVPHNRGFGTTRFLSDATMRNGQQGQIALDVVALMDALKIEKTILAGYDWGGRSANIIAALWPERVKAMVSVNGYLINNRQRNQLPLAPKAEHGWWYQFYFATERGKAGYTANTRDFNELMWRNNSPSWKFDADTYARTAASFENPDHAAIVIHNYRWRLSLADGDPALDDLEAKLAAGPAITVPSITIDGDSDGVVPATDGSGQAKRFAGPRQHRILKGVGHNLPQEAPRDFAQAVIDVDAM
ncbi:alpha/beta fold hydrolase [Dongia rigui]|uniref:Alpha/beta hydrolase n=1 Tax=Dongia rigui TaxID=940149 RepID=A0ABU5DWB3_9PROT|nr:alpha/beta hydrolase [Dongia rigui]MDY0871601.1 alpha/beta hydrolase [Dongia rigui]